jgi:vancomycin resistance protein YoaR
MPRVGVRIIAIAIGLLVLLGGAFAALARENGSEVPPNVEIDGVAVGGLSRDEADTLIRRHARGLIDERTVIESPLVPDFSESVTRRSLQAQPQIAAALDLATEGRDPLARALGRLGLGETRQVPLEFSYDAQSVEALLDRVSGALDVAPRSAGLTVDEAGISLVPSQTGRRVQRERLREGLAAFPRRVEAPVSEAPPPVLEAAAERARTKARALLATPPTVILGTVRASLTEADVRNALGFVPDPPRLRVTLDPDLLRERLGPSFSDGEREPRDAAFEIVGDRVRLTPSRPGRGVDMDRLAETLVARAGRPLTGARFARIPPEFTTAEARKLRITERIASFTTPYACCPSRVTNIQRGAQILDGTIIPAGGRFSLNEALGRRTAERGFVAAGQIVNGRLEDAVGGGVSQIATTVYNAAFFGGLEIITHTPHQFYISRYPEGREATVSWGGPELIVRNDWPAAVLMRVAAGSSNISVDLYSTALGREVETEVTSKQAGRGPRVNEKLNRDLEPGTRKVVQSAGAAGFTITYTRRVLVNGKVKRDETYRWRYSAQDAFVEVGPPEKKEPKDGKDPPEPKQPEDEPGAGAPPAGGESPDAPAAPATPPAAGAGADEGQSPAS